MGGTGWQLGRIFSELTDTFGGNIYSPLLPLKARFYGLQCSYFIKYLRSYIDTY